MGIIVRNQDVAGFRDAIDLAFGDDKAKAAAAKVVVRTDKGQDPVLYLDAENGKLVITGESFYETKKRKASRTALTAVERQQLADAFDAIMGVASEHGPEFFDSYHKRGGDGLFGELEKIFIKIAPEEMKKVLA